MSELKRCPFCGGEVKIDVDDFYMFCCDKCGAGVTFAKELEDGTAVDCNKEEAIAAWNRRTPDTGNPVTENTPLGLEELRGMDGEPVWIVAHPDWGHWELSVDAKDYFEDRDEDFYGMTMPPALPDPMGRYGLHMMGWLAYRQKPEAKEEAE